MNQRCRVVVGPREATVELLDLAAEEVAREQTLELFDLDAQDIAGS